MLFEFNKFWAKLHRINFHWKISMSENIFPLEVFDFCVLLSSIMRTLWEKSETELNSQSLSASQSDVKMFIHQLISFFESKFIVKCHFQHIYFVCRYFEIYRHGHLILDSLWDARMGCSCLYKTIQGCIHEARPYPCIHM